MPIPLGILAAAGRSQAPAGAFQLLESTVLTGAQAAVEFTNLTTKYAATYQHLQIRLVARTNRAEINDGVFMQLNGVTTASYSRHFLIGDNNSLTAAADANITQMAGGALPGANATANAYGAAIIDILDPFETSKNTTQRMISGVASNFSQVNINSGAFYNTNSVTSIRLFNLANYVTGSRFSLYGIKATA